MTVDRDSMVVIPRLDAAGKGPRRRAKEQRQKAKMEQEKKGLLSRLREARAARRLQEARAARSAVRRPRVPAGRPGLGSRVAGAAGVAFLFVEAVNILGRTARRGELGVSGRLLDAMDQDTRYGQLDEVATGIATARGQLEGNEDLMRIVGIQGRVNSQIAEIGAWFKERETARAIGADLIEREPTFDHIDTIIDQGIQGAALRIKNGADAAVNAIRSLLGKGPLTR